MALTNADRLRAVMLALGQHSVFGESAPTESLIDYFKKYTPADYVACSYVGQTYNSDAIPTMTSETTPSGTVTYSSQYSTSYPAWAAFNDAGGFWRAISYNEWIAYEFTSPKVIMAYSIYPVSATYSPTSWTFEGYNGSSWVTLDTRTSEAFADIRYYLVDNTTAYSKYRLSLSRASGTIRIIELELMEAE